MSYDLMAFDPAAAPKARDEFLSWYHQQTRWSEDHDYNDPVVCTPPLRAFYQELILTFPPMNGPYANGDDTDDVDDSKVTDYSVGRTVIYACFSWSEQEQAYETVRALAGKYKVGFFDVSADNGEIANPLDP